MKLLTKHVKLTLIAVFALLMAACMFFAASFASADEAKTKIRLDFVANNGFENYASSLTDGYMALDSVTSPPYFGGITKTDLNSGETVGFVNNAYTGNSTALRFWGGYLMYQFNQNVYGKPVADFNYNVSFDAAAGNTSANSNYLAGFTPIIVIIYTDTENVANKVLEIKLGGGTGGNEGLFYAKGAADATTAAWNDIQVSFNYSIDSSNQLILNTTWGGDAAANPKPSSLAQAPVGRENYVAGTGVKEVTEMQFRIKGGGNAGLANVYIDNVEIYTEFDVNSSIFEATATEKPSDEYELISDGNMSSAEVGKSETQTYYLNSAKTIAAVPNGKTISVVKDGYTGSAAAELTGGYINLSTANMVAGGVYDFSFDVKQRPSFSTYDNQIGSVYSQVVLYNSSSFFADTRIEADANGNENKNGRIYTITKGQAYFEKYFLTNYATSAEETYTAMYSGNSYADWANVSYRIWYEFNESGEVIFHAKRMTNNATSSFASYSNQGTANPELVLNLGVQDQVTKAEFRIYVDKATVLVDNISLKEVIDKEITGYTKPADATVAYGEEHGLPTSIELVTDSGNVSSTVTYTGNYDKNIAGEYALTGTIARPVNCAWGEGVSSTFTVEVTVSPKTVTGYTLPENKTVAFGAEHGLPTSLELTTDSGNISSEVSYSGDYNKETVGKYTLTGTIALPANCAWGEGVSSTFTVEVTVNAIEVTAYTAPENKTVDNGTEHGLPTTLTVTTASGTTEVTVEYSGNYDKNTAGEYTLTGTVILPANYAFAEGVSNIFTVKVTVNAKPTDTPTDNPSDNPTDNPSDTPTDTPEKSSGCNSSVEGISGGIGFVAVLIALVFCTLIKKEKI